MRDEGVEANAVQQASHSLLLNCSLTLTQCPGIALEQDILKQVNAKNSFVLSFENKTPARQLHYVDLHLSKVRCMR
jgi:hypothetical protein